MKNMKLTNLSLSVLVALGLVACGGSDNKDNAPVDKKPDTGHTDAGGGSDNGNKDTGPKIENNGKEMPVDPRRAAPSLKVEENVATSTKVAKQLYIDRRSRDAIAGYNGGSLGVGATLNTVDGNKTPYTTNQWNSIRGSRLAGGVSLSGVENGGGMTYNPGSTDAADILRESSIYNYYEFQSKQGSLNINGGIHANPNFSYVLGKDGWYYRVVPVGRRWDDVRSDTVFRLVDTNTWGNGNFYGTQNSGGNSIPMKDVVFIPNALTINSDPNAAIPPTGNNANGEFQAHIPSSNLVSTDRTLQNDQSKGGINRLNPKNLAYFNINRGEVEYKSFDLAGIHYDLVKDFNTDNIELDLSKVPVKKEIQTYPITLDYVIKNNQATGTLSDDDNVNKTAKVGAMKVYNLPYSRSSITVNQQAVADANDPNAASNNLFNLAGTGTDGHYGPFQVVGFQTTAIPRDGRADYVGKSYGVNSVGDIELRADFAIERAGIHGSVSNRKTIDGKQELANLTLGRIALVDPRNEETASQGMQSTSNVLDGTVSVGGRGVGTWAVALYGPNAEEAAGIIDLGWVDDNTSKKFEVFSAQRGSLIKDSLNPGVGVSTSK